MIFAITNSRITIHGADPFILHVLDTELRYPSAVTELLQHQKALPQSEELAEANAYWDGWIRLLHKPKVKPPWIPTGLLQTAKRLCDKMGYAVSIDDQREKTEPGFPELSSKIPLRDYQEEAVAAA
ncbi:MAG: hypothetical protein KAJ19_13420, partial [Gammaproteobacteria bacterium]|nr:hypothetical protein [Gammaproteobacteria bacterium]